MVRATFISSVAARSTNHDTVSLDLCTPLKPGLCTHCLQGDEPLEDDEEEYEEEGEEEDEEVIEVSTEYTQSSHL